MRLRGLGVMGCGVALTVGCASPGAPKPPSLQMPAVVRDLALTRVGDEVRLRFSVPARTTDGVALRGPVEARLCRQVGAGAACAPVDAGEIAGAETALRPGEAVAWTDRLPAELAVGAARAMSYRVELRNAAGRTAGYGDAAYVAAGAAPPVVADFRAEGTRLGVLLQWAPVVGGGEVLLERRALDVAAGPVAGGRRERKGEPGVVMLQANPDADKGNAAVGRTLDGSVVEGERYRYEAERRVVAQLGGRRLELFSAPSTAVEIAWRDVYPPAAPEGLTGVGFATPAVGTATAGYAVDLVWQPVDDPRVSGYVVRRVRLDAAGEPVGAAVRLTAAPVAAPGFHDATAVAGVRYRYEVTAVDARGNASGAAVVVVGG